MNCASQPVRRRIHWFYPAMIPSEELRDPVVRFSPSGARSRRRRPSRRRGRPGGAAMAFLARAFALTFAAALLFPGGSVAQPPPPAAPVDQYGGVARGVAPATGYFQVKQVG